MLVHEFLENSADQLPDKVALVCDGQRLTYSEIDARANCLANYLRNNDFKHGDRVALYLSNCIELVIAIFGVLKAGGVFIVVNITTKADKLLRILNDSGATVFLYSGQPPALITELSTECTALKKVITTTLVSVEEKKLDVILYSTIQAHSSPSRPKRVNIDLDLACLIYTSGSTGVPKGVMSDHSNVDFATESIISYLHNREDDVVIDVLPLSFDYGLYQLLMVFKFGGTLVLEKSFAFPAAILKKIETEKVTGFPGVPTIYTLLLRMDLSQFKLSSLRYLTNTAAALPKSHILQICEKFSWATLYSMYGLTETKRTLYLPPDQLDKRPDSVGIAIPGTEVWIEDEAGNRLGGGEVGELVVRGRHVMRGYWNDPDMTARRYRPGSIPGERYCYTGDLFRMDEEGFFYFVSRRDDIIKSRGEKVSPVEIERVMYDMEGVIETAVIGVPDAVLGQAVKVFVVTDGRQINEKDVLSYCRAHLEDFMMPKIVEFRSELPKTSSGKIKKTDLS